MKRWIYFGKYKWVRKFKGGKWEGWIMDFPIVNTWWFQMDKFTNERPHQLCRGTPTREEYQ